MVEGQRKQVGQAAAAARLGVACAVDDPLQAAVDDGPAAHGAGLQRHEQLALPEPPAAQRLAGRINGQQLGVVGGVFAALAQVVGAGDDLPVLGDDRPDRDLAQCGGKLCLRQRGAHQFFIGHSSPSMHKKYRIYDQKDHSGAVGRAGEHRQHIHAGA